jgi:hypothetical protein
VSNHKYAYGWSGHILCRKSEHDGNKRDNVIAIDDEVFDRIATNMGDCELDPRIEVHQLGWLSIETVYYLAAGVCFTESFAHYGCPFAEAEAREGPVPVQFDHDGEYIKAMKEIYGITLPPCRLMIGCSSEH